MKTKTKKSEIVKSDIFLTQDSFISGFVNNDWGYQNTRVVTPTEYVLHYLKKLPASYSYESIKSSILDYLKENFTLLSYKKDYNTTNKLVDERYTFIKDSLGIFFIKEHDDTCSISIVFPVDTEVDLSFIEPYIIKKSGSNIGMIFKGTLGDLQIKKLKIKNYQMEDLDLYYGTNFSSVNEKFINSIKSDDSGLYILNGPPGTGKSSYIRHLSSIIDDKTFIYIPEFMARSLGSPDLIELLMENKGSILILEDAEQHIKNREDSDSNIVSTLLNITDGLLSDLMNIKVIVTYNAENVNIDKALLRKSRLKYKHEFKPLDVKESQKLIDHLKLNYNVKNPMTLAEIFKVNDSFEYEDTKKKNTKLGF